MSGYVRPWLRSNNFGEVCADTLRIDPGRRVMVSEGRQVSYQELDERARRVAGLVPPLGVTAGDAFVEIHIEPHAFFRRKDDNIHVEVPVGLAEAVLGGKIQVPTIDGPVTMTVPPGSKLLSTAPPGSAYPSATRTVSPKRSVAGRELLV